jgi:hypothetical protein
VSDKLLREKAAKADESTAALAAARRENALLKSGIDLEHPTGQLFAQSYDGELTVDALRAEAARYSVPLRGQAPATPTTGTQVVEETIEPTGTAERMALSDGSPADTGEDKDPRQISNEHFDKRMAEGLPREDAAAESLNILAQAAMRGDSRVIVK